MASSIFSTQAKLEHEKSKSKMIGFQRTKILAQVEDIDLCVEMVESSNPAPNLAFSIRLLLDEKTRLDLNNYRLASFSFNFYHWWATGIA